MRGCRLASSFGLDNARIGHILAAVTCGFWTSDYVSLLLLITILFNTLLNPRNSTPPLFHKYFWKQHPSKKPAEVPIKPRLVGTPRDASKDATLPMSCFKRALTQEHQFSNCVCVVFPPWKKYSSSFPRDFRMLLRYRPREWRLGSQKQLLRGHHFPWEAWRTLAASSSAMIQSPTPTSPIHPPLP